MSPTIPGFFLLCLVIAVPFDQGMLPRPLWMFHVLKVGATYLGPFPRLRATRTILNPDGLHPRRHRTWGHPLKEVWGLLVWFGLWPRIIGLLPGPLCTQTPSPHSPVAGRPWQSYLLTYRFFDFPCYITQNQPSAINQIVLGSCPLQGCLCLVFALFRNE